MSSKWLYCAPCCVCRHEYYFEVTAVSTGSNSTTFQLKAELEEDMQRWVKQIQHQVCATPR